MYSCTSLGVKLGGGLGTAVTGWLLAFSNYDKALAVQPESCINMPLRYNYDKPEKPRISRAFGYLARFFILFQTEKSSREVVIS